MGWGPARRRAWDPEGDRATETACGRDVGTWELTSGAAEVRGTGRDSVLVAASRSNAYSILLGLRAPADSRFHQSGLGSAVMVIGYRETDLGHGALSLL